MLSKEHQESIFLFCSRNLSFTKIDIRRVERPVLFPVSFAWDNP